MTPDELLRELEPLTHDARMRRMVEVGRLAATDARVAATLAALERGGWYERRLALQSCFGSGNGARVLRALADPSRSIRALAATLVPVACDDAQALAALDAAPRDWRRSLLRKLYRRGRRAAIDAHLAALAERNDESLAELLPYGSPAVVARSLADVLPRAGADAWRRLARLHPDLAADALAERAAAADRLDQRLAWLAAAVLPLLARSRPDRALAQVELLRRHIPLHRLELQRLAERRPVAVADLLLAGEERAPVSLDRVAHRLDAPRLLALVERRPETLRDRWHWFRRLPPAARAAVYAVVERGWRDGEGALTHELVALLPREEREREGRRHLALPALAARPAQRLPYAAFLPWDEARAALEPFVRHPDPELRAAALGTLAFAARYERDRLPELLALVRARRNEQDPVRGAMLRGLADLPPGVWRAEHLDDLGGVVGEALAAADLSVVTASSAERLVVALLPFHPAWAAGWLATLVQERGQVSFYNLGDRLSDADVRRVAPDLLPVFNAWETREREWNLIGAAQSLGRRLRAFGELVEILERVLRDTRASWAADSILALLALWRRDRLAALVPALIGAGRTPLLRSFAGDPSWITRPVVQQYLHRRRQDLLTPFLGQRAYSGRFSTGKTRYVLPLVDGFGRWTPAQQSTFAATLREVTNDRARDVPAMLMVVRQLAALPAVEPVRLIQLADERNPKLAVRDAALLALGGLDAGQGVPVLLEALNDERGRVAIYALRGALLGMPPERALPLLRAAPLDRVTVAKEVVRLIGELRAEEAYRELLALDGRQLHRDVRVALLRALWDWPERDETWPILERAARSDDAALAAGVVRIPADRLSPAAQGRLGALLALLLGHPEPKVRLDTLARCAALPVADAERALLPPLLAALGSPLPDECAAGARAVFATYVGRDAPLVGAAIARILPNRRALLTAVATLQGTLWWDRDRLLPTARAVLAALATDPLTASLRVELAAHALPADELAVLLQRAAEDDELHAEALMRVADAMGGVAARVAADDLARLEEALRGSADARLRRLALAVLVADAGGTRGWDEDRLARLRIYRADPAPLVAAAAQFTFPPVEEG